MSFKKDAQREFLRLIEVLETLRGEGGCEWDRAQTSKSLLPYFQEETAEAIEAIEAGDTQSTVEELGDVTLHVLFQARILQEEKKADISHSLKAISDKLIRRHPHIFNNAEISDVDAWETLKHKENKRDYFIDGVPLSLPALLHARRIQEKAAGVKFDWEDFPPVLEKVEEELQELKEAIAENDSSSIEDELGDLLFSIVNFSRKLDINPESALKSSSKKFMRRFKEIEERLKAKGSSLQESNPEEMNEIWDAVKVLEKSK